MADDSDIDTTKFDPEIQATGKKYGWSPKEMQDMQERRNSIPAGPSASPSPSGASGAQGLSPSSGSLNPQNIDPTKAANVAAAFNGGANGMAHGGKVEHTVTHGGNVMQGSTVVADHGRPALGYDHAPHFAHGGQVHTPVQVPGLEPAQQQLEMRRQALNKLKEHDRHRVRQPEPKKPK